MRVCGSKPRRLFPDRRHETLALSKDRLSDCLYIAGCKTREYPALVEGL